MMRPQHVQLFSIPVHKRYWTFYPHGSHSKGEMFGSGSQRDHIVPASWASAKTISEKGNYVMYTITKKVKQEWHDFEHATPGTFKAKAFKAFTALTDRIDPVENIMKSLAGSVTVAIRLFVQILREFV